VLGRNSIYEWGLYRLAMGRFYVAEGRFDYAVEPLADAARQFESGGQLVEMSTALLYLAAAQATTQPEAAIGSLTAALVSAFRLETRHAIIAAARAVQPNLAQLRVDAAYRAQMDQLLEEIREFAAALPATRRQVRRLVTTALSIAPDSPVPLVIRALGRVEAYGNGRLIGNSDWQTQAARELFFCLLAHPDGLTKEQIGALFWPDCTTEQLKTRFKNTIYRMRSAIGSDDFVTYVDGVYRFNQAADYEYDVEDFLVKRSEAAHTVEPSARIAAYQAAVDLYRGSFLPSFAGGWVIVERERLHRLFVDLCLELAALYLVSDQASLGLIACQRVLAEDSCLEEAHRLAMRIHAAMGNRAGIASQYAQCRQALFEEIDAPPSPQTEDLYARLME
jgi:LuxR family transcriptional regulator, maltose regulon positive regulatory protein